MSEVYKQTAQVPNPKQPIGTWRTGQKLDVWIHQLPVCIKADQHVYLDFLSLGISNNIQALREGDDWEWQGSEDGRDSRGFTSRENWYIIRIPQMDLARLRTTKWGKNSDFIALALKYRSHVESSNDVTEGKFYCYSDRKCFVAEWLWLLPIMLRMFVWIPSQLHFLLVETYFIPKYIILQVILPLVIPSLPLSANQLRLLTGNFKVNLLKSRMHKWGNDSSDVPCLHSYI